VECAPDPLNLAERIDFSPSHPMLNKGNQIPRHHTYGQQQSYRHHYPSSLSSSSGCLDNQFKCSFDHRCISRKKVCNGHYDCMLGEDEKDCPKERVVESNDVSAADLRRDTTSFFSKRSDVSLGQLHSLNCQCSCEPLGRKK